MSSHSSGFAATPEENSENDTLIDEMQERMGELLKYPQELSAAQNELELLKRRLALAEQEKEKQQEEIRSMQGKADQVAKERLQFEKQLSAVTREREELKSTVEALQAELREAQDASVQEVHQKVSLQAADFKRVTDAKDRQIAEMNARIEELKTAEAKNMDVIVRQANDCEQLTKENAELASQSEQRARENAIVQHDIEVLTRHVQDYKQLLSTEKQRRKKAEAMLASAMQEKTSLQQIQTEKESEIDDLVGKLVVIDELNAKLAETETQFELMFSKYNKMKRRYARLIAEV
jgi:chromosome segregation ATPase